MPYEGPGIYRHYKGGLYEALEPGMLESDKDTLGDRFDPDDPEQQFILYRPLTPGGKLDDKTAAYWIRGRCNFDTIFHEDVVDYPPPTPRFKRETCVVCEKNTLKHVGGGMVVCSTCGNNQR